MTRNARIALVSAAFLLGIATSANAALVKFATTLSGATESPPNASTATGNAVITFDTATNLLTMDFSFAGLGGTARDAHIHCCTTVPGVIGGASVATQNPFPDPIFTNFDSLDAVDDVPDVTSAVINHVFDMTLTASFNGAFLGADTPAAAMDRLLQGMLDGRAYFNVHSNLPGGVPGGEIAGFLVQVPEPASIALFGVGLAGLGMMRRRRKPAAASA